MDLPPPPRTHTHTALRSPLSLLSPSLSLSLSFSFSCHAQTMGPWRIPACAELFKSAVAASRRAKERGKEVEEREWGSWKVRECGMMGRGCGGREKEVDGEKGIVEVVNLVVSACKSPLAPRSLPPSLSSPLSMSHPLPFTASLIHICTPAPPLHLRLPLSALSQ